MTTLSVPLSSDLLELVERLAKKNGSNKAQVVRRALKILAEEEAVMAVIKAEQEPIIRGDLKKLMKKF